MVVVRSPAKLNLYLKVLGKYPNGYHKLVTLFHRISLADTIQIRKRPIGFVLKISQSQLSAGEDNLITRAYRRLQKEIPDLGGVSVYLKKNIPIGAGLGGGSGNAAAFLLGIKKLYGLKISKPKLLKIGAELGADVPFFIHDLKQAIGIGRGDEIKPLAIKSKLWFVLVTSRESLSTKEVYENLQRSKAPSIKKVSQTVRKLAALLEKKKIDAAASLLENDLESSAFRLRPALRTFLQMMRKNGTPASRMSGSGPTFYAILPSSSSARNLARKLQNLSPEKRVVVCHSL